MVMKACIKGNVPIVGIWIAPSLEVSAAVGYTHFGYTHFDAIFNGTDLQTIWIELTYEAVSGNNVPTII
jgi:hypothetical protein